MSAAPPPNWYDVLDVDPSATTEEVRDAWRVPSARVHAPGPTRF